MILLAAINWDRVVIRIVIWIAVILVIGLVRVAIRAVRKTAAKPKENPLPPPPIPKAGQVRNAVVRGISGVYQGTDVPFDEKPIVLGRDPDVANLVFPSDTRAVSGRHCVIKYEGGEFLIEDCRSTNGTFLAGGKAIAPGQQVKIKPGTRFYLGEAANTFEVNLF